MYTAYKTTYQLRELKFDTEREALDYVHSLKKSVQKYYKVVCALDLTWNVFAILPSDEILSSETFQAAEKWCEDAPCDSYILNGKGNICCRIDGCIKELNSIESVRFFKNKILCIERDTSNQINNVIAVKRIENINKHIEHILESEGISDERICIS